MGDKVGPKGGAGGRSWIGVWGITLSTLRRTERQTETIVE